MTDIEAFWTRFRAETGHPDVPYQVGGSAEEHPEVATTLAALLLEGRKRATAGLLAEHEDEAQPLPAVGDLERFERIWPDARP